IWEGDGGHDDMNEHANIVAPNAKEQEKLPDKLQLLLYWLANEDIYTSPYVRNWLKRTPRDEAADILARIADYAQPESRSIVNMLVLGLVMMFTTSQVVLPKSPAGRKAGIRAAL